MVNNIKKSLYTVAGVVLVAQNNLANAIDFGDNSNRIKSGVVGTSESADIAIQSLIGKASVFLALLAVIFGMWGGFQILTARGADDKVKKGKTILIQAILGLIVIFLAYSIVHWLVGSILGSTNN